MQQINKQLKHAHNTYIYKQKKTQFNETSTEASYIKKNKQTEMQNKLENIIYVKYIYSNKV